MVTEIGRQPWIVHGFMRVEDAVTPAQGIWWIFAFTLTLYAVLGAVAVLVLRGMAQRWRSEAVDEAGMEAPYSPRPEPPRGGEAAP
jgi:cytochrome d ubiquinol oxidase subunit I